MKVSVIIPTLNEATHLAHTLDCLRSGAIAPFAGCVQGDFDASSRAASHDPADIGAVLAPDIEIIIADGGSHDQTIALAAAAGVVVVHSAPGRAHQLNTAAQQATGDIYLFLHADTQLPQNWPRWVIHTLQNANNIAGAFELAIGSDRPGIRLVEWGVQVRSRLLQLPYGDQAIFLRAETFQQLGGFADLSIMEDFQFVKRLQAFGHIAIVPAKVMTSGRRWEKLGVMTTTLLNQAIILGFYLGIPPERLRTWYRGVQRPSNTRSRTR